MSGAGGSGPVDALGPAVVVGFGPGVGDATARAFAAAGHGMALLAGPPPDGAPTRVEAAVRP